MYLTDGGGGMDGTERQKVMLGIAVCLALLYAGFVFGGGSVSDLFRGTDPARKELDRAAGYQRQAEQGIRDAEKSAEGITGAIDGSQKAVSDAQGTAGRIEIDGQRAGVVIAECQQIIETVRRRGKIPATQN